MSQKLKIQKCLSKGLLGMKFMQKSKDQREEEEDRKESQAILSKNIPKILKSADIEIKVVSSYKEVEDLGTGRVSFRGMNPQVEKIMRDQESAEVDAFLKRQRDESNRPEISDEAMASVLGKNIKNRFTKKRARKQPQSDDSDCEIVGEQVRGKKPKFLKPAED